MFKKLLMVCVVCLLAMPMTASAQKRKLQVQNKGQHHDPIRVAPIKGWENGKPILGEWVAFDKSGLGPGAPFPEGVLIDSFEGDSNYGNPDLCDADPTVNSPANGPLSGGVSPACDFGAGLTGDCGNGSGNRWFLGFERGVNEPAWAGAIGAVGNFADNAPNVATAMTFGWSQSFGVDAAPPCEGYVSTLIIVNYYDNTVASLIDSNNVQDLDTTVLTDGFVDGIILDFGPLASSTMGFAFASIDLTKDDPELHLGIVDSVEVGLPSDGALEVLYWDDDGLGNPVPGSYAQPMLWAPKDSALQGAWTAGFYYLDGAFDGAANTHDCAAYDGQYLVSTDDQTAQFDDAGWPGGCPLILMPAIGLFGVPSTTGPVTVVPETVTPTLGDYVSGDVVSLAFSDNNKYSMRRKQADVNSRTEFTVRGVSPTETPVSFGITLEGSAFFRSPVDQIIELYDYNVQAWVEVDARPASRLVDQVVSLTGFGGDLARFVEPGTRNVEARVRFLSQSRRQNFSSSVDQWIWTIE